MAAAWASFPISSCLVKIRKPFRDGDLLREATAIAAHTVFYGSKDKEDIKAALRCAQLEGTWREPGRNLKGNLEGTETAPFPETRMVSLDATTTEGFLSARFYNNFKNRLERLFVPIHKLVVMTTDGTQA